MPTEAHERATRGEREARCPALARGPHTVRLEEEARASPGRGHIANVSVAHTPALVLRDQRAAVGAMLGWSQHSTVGKSCTIKGVSMKCSIMSKRSGAYD